MAVHNINPVREQLRGEILSALAVGQDPMTTGDLYLVCPSATDAEEVAKVAYEMRKKGIIADGGKVPHPRGSPVNSYRLPNTDDPRIEAAKPIKVERKIPRTINPPKPPKGHPFAASIRLQEAHDALPRVSRDLPIHLQSTAPQAAAVALDEAEMSEEPMPYFTDVDTFSQEPMDHENEPNVDLELVDYSIVEGWTEKDAEDFHLEPSEPDVDVDSDLVDALLEMAHLEQKDQAVDDVLAMSAADVGEIAAAMGKGHESAPKKECKCIRLNSLPPLPSGYRFASIVASIFSEHDGETMDVHVVDEGGGPFVKIYMTGGLGFGLGDLALIGQVADALINLHQDMSHE